MNKEEIKKLEPFFVCYIEGKYIDLTGWCDGEQCKRFFHKEQSDFHIILFPETNVLYQIDPDGDIYGVELETYDELIIRFESFTKEKIDDIDPRTMEVWDDADQRFGLENLTSKVDDGDDYEEEKHYADE